MAGKPVFRNRMGVEDVKHGEQERAGRARGGQGDNRLHTGRKPDDGIISEVGGPDSKRGGNTWNEDHMKDYPTTLKGDREHEYGHGSGNSHESPPNTVPMEIKTRGSSAAGDYRNTGEEGGAGISRPRRGTAMGNNEQASYNHHPGRSGQGKEGEVLGRYQKADFYNDIEGHSAKGERGSEDESGTGTDEYGKMIEGFGSGHNTFGETSNFYNQVGKGHESDAECNSGSGLINDDKSSGPKRVRGFSVDAGEIQGKI
jgi:hypothetical protein